MSRGLELNWAISPGLRQPAVEFRPTGLWFTLTRNHPERIGYRDGWIQFAIFRLPTAEAAWVAVKDGRGQRGAIVIFRAQADSQILEMHREGFRTENLPAEKIMLRLVREGFGRVVR